MTSTINATLLERMGRGTDPYYRYLEKLLQQIQRQIGTGVGEIDLSGSVLWGIPVDDDIIPDTDSLRDIGNTSVRFASFFVDDVTVTTNIAVGGTVDGRDLSVDGAKLDTVATGADAWGTPVDTNITLDADSTYDFGTTTVRLANVYTDTVNGVDIESLDTLIWLGL